ncbi:MAG TPA: glutamine--fructose-6-phosphate aminotransferase, partial [Rhodanobacteraceae bacterium]|nr:glutamine--fructose-6-phosphate aminotransferase [Rhodanobacteraceae bacterium]
MCGIVAATARENVVPILIAGLKALEYRGYDSAGIAILEGDRLTRVRTPGKVRDLESLYQQSPVEGFTGIAHTRWATHGVPNTVNAHPHVSDDRVAVVHNGIIENHAELREELKAHGYRFDSDTDTEVIAHLVHQAMDEGADLLHAVIRTTQRLHGAYAIAVMSRDQPGHVVGARRGSPLVAGIGEGEHFLGSDVQALIKETSHFTYLEEGDVAEITRDGIHIYTADGTPVERPVRKSELTADAVERGEYKHYMLKEIFEQPRAIADTLEGRIAGDRILPN